MRYHPPLPMSPSPIRVIKTLSKNRSKKRRRRYEENKCSYDFDKKVERRENEETRRESERVRPLTCAIDH